MKKLLALSLLLLASIAHAGDSIHVSAAISLKESIELAAKAFEAETRTHIDLDLGASGALETQIINGAPVDLFIAAADKQVDDLIAKKLADPATRRLIARNALVLITPTGKEGPKSFADLANDSVKRIATGEPRTVPAGDYAKQIFESLKLTDALKPKLVFGANVRQVLDYVKRGEVDAGLVYRSDVLSAKGDVTIVAEADAAWCKPINYPAIIPSASSHPDQAKAFADFLLSNEGQDRLTRRGFQRATDEVQK